MSIAVRDAVAVGDHQRRPVVGLGLAERRAASAAGRRPSRPARRRRCRSAIACSARSFVRRRLAGGGELRDRAERRRLGHLPAGVGVDLGVEHQHVDVAPAGEHVVQPAGADVVGPAVAADDPHAAPDQVVERRCAGRRPPAPSSCVEPPLAARRRRSRCARSSDSRSCGASGSRPPARAPDLRRAARDRRRRASSVWRSAASRKPEPELGVVLEQRVRPRRAAAVGVGRPRRGRQVAAVDRRAAGRVGDRQPVAEQLREQLEVRASRRSRRRRRRTRTAAPGTGCRGPCRSPRASGRSTGSVSKNAMFSRSAATQRLARVEVDRLATGLAAAPRPGRPRRTARSRCSPRRTPAACSGCPAGPGALSGADRKPSGAPSSAHGS